MITVDAELMEREMKALQKRYEAEKVKKGSDGGGTGSEVVIMFTTEELQ